MKKALVALLAFGFASCDCTEYARADRDTLSVLEPDLLYGIENNPENNEEVKEAKLMLIDSWRFRINATLGDKQ